MCKKPDAGAIHLSVHHDDMDALEQLADVMGYTAGELISDFIRDLLQSDSTLYEWLQRSSWNKSGYIAVRCPSAANTSLLLVRRATSRQLGEKSNQNLRKP